MPENEKLFLWIDALETISKYSFEIGVFSYDAWRTFTISVLNTDDTRTQVTMPLEDIIYLTEHGTMTVPARPVLKHICKWVTEHMNPVIDDVIDGMVNRKWNEIDVDARFRIFENQINAQIPIIVNEQIRSNGTLANILNIDDDYRYLFDMATLSQYIQCHIIKKTSQN